MAPPPSNSFAGIFSINREHLARRIRTKASLVLTRTTRIPFDVSSIICSFLSPIECGKVAQCCHPLESRQTEMEIDQPATSLTELNVHKKFLHQLAMGHSLDLTSPAVDTLLHRQTSSSITCSPEYIRLMQSFLVDLMEVIWTSSYELVYLRQKKMISARHVQAAIRWKFPTELLKEVVAEAVKAVTIEISSETRTMEHYNPFGEHVYNFSHSFVFNTELQRLFFKSEFSNALGHSATVYCASALTTFLNHLLEQSRTVAAEEQSSMLLPHHLARVMQNENLKSFFRGAVIPTYLPSAPKEQTLKGNIQTKLGYEIEDQVVEMIVQMAKVFLNSTLKDALDFMDDKSSRISLQAALSAINCFPIIGARFHVYGLEEVGTNSSSFMSQADASLEALLEQLRVTQTDPIPTPPIHCDTLFPHFEAIAKEVLQSLKEDSPSIEPRAILAFQLGFEYLLKDFLQLSHLCASHRSSKLIGPQDFQLVVQVRGIHPFHPHPWDSPPLHPVPVEGSRNELQQFLDQQSTWDAISRRRIETISDTCLVECLGVLKRNSHVHFDRQLFFRFLEQTIGDGKLYFRAAAKQFLMYLAEGHILSVLEDAQRCVTLAGRDKIELEDVKLAALLSK